MHLFIKEFKKLLRLFRSDPKSIGAGIVPPTVILLAFFFTVGNFSSIRISVFNYDTGNYGQILKESILTEKSPLGNKAYFENVDTDLESAQELFEKNQLYAYLIIPKNFSEELENGQTPKIDFHFNNYNTDIAKNLRLYLSEGILSFYRTTDPSLQIKVIEQQNVPQQLPWFEIIASGVFMLSFLLGVVINTLYLLSLEKRNGTLLFYQLAPVNILPSIAARAIVGLLSGTIAATVNGIFIYLLTGNNYLPYVIRMLPALLIIGLIYIFASIIIGLYIDSFAGSIIFGLLGTCILWFLSGATFSIKNNTGALCAVSRCIPNTYVLSDIRGIIFSMDKSIGSVSYLNGWMILIAYLCITFALTCIVYYRKLSCNHQ